jgi:NADH:ubiquinone oxidoreductase subunit 4 (subunit M)
VGISYSWFSTRQLSFLRGALISSPLLAFISSLGLLYSISAPPFPSFVREVMFMLCSVSFTS